jgi:hypothetical protein
VTRGIAADPRLPSIIAAIEGGRSMRAAAKDFGVGEDALNRYFAKYGARAPKVPGRPPEPDASDGQSIWSRLQSQMKTLETMASAPGISSRGYLDIIGQMRLLSAEMLKHQPPVERDIPTLIVQSEEWIRLREAVVEWLIREDPTRGLEHRFQVLIKTELGRADS